MIAPASSCSANLDDGLRSAPPSREEEDPPIPATEGYVDGEYSARGWYGSLPSRQDVTVTLKNGIVTSVEITTPAEDQTSLGYQQRFADALPDAIIGKSIDDIVVDRLAGSSGCSEGFMRAINEIRDNAGQ